MVFEKGKAVQGSFLFIKFVKSNAPETRMNFIISSKVLPGAVDRNRIKRVLSETARQYLKGKGNTGYDISVVVRKHNEEKTLVTEFIKLLDKIHDQITYKNN